MSLTVGSWARQLRVWLDLYKIWSSATSPVRRQLCYLSTGGSRCKLVYSVAYSVVKNTNYLNPGYLAEKKWGGNHFQLSILVVSVVGHNVTDTAGGVKQPKYPVPPCENSVGHIRTFSRPKGYNYLAHAANGLSVLTLLSFKKSMITVGFLAQAQTVPLGTPNIIPTNYVEF